MSASTTSKILIYPLLLVTCIFGCARTNYNNPKLMTTHVMPNGDILLGQTMYNVTSINFSDLYRSNSDIEKYMLCASKEYGNLHITVSSEKEMSNFDIYRAFRLLSNYQKIFINTGQNKVQVSYQCNMLEDNVDYKKQERKIIYVIASNKYLLKENMHSFEEVYQRWQPDEFGLDEVFDKKLTKTTLKKGLQSKEGYVLQIVCSTTTKYGDLSYLLDICAKNKEVLGIYLSFM